MQCYPSCSASGIVDNFFGGGFPAPMAHYIFEIGRGAQRVPSTTEEDSDGSVKYDIA